MKSALFKRIESILDLNRNTKYQVLEIGCGRGDFLGQISNSISPDSYLVGIDSIDIAIETAKETYSTLAFRCEKFTDTLNFENNSLDIVVSIDTLECIPNKSALVNEIHRVLKPDGIVVFAHWDWDTQVFNSDNRSIIRTLVAAFSDWQQEWMEASDGQMGRRLWGLFEGSGMFKGTIASFTLLETEYREGNFGFARLQDMAELTKNGCIASTDYELICREMRELSDAGEYFYSVNSYIYAGKPA